MTAIFHEDDVPERWREYVAKATEYFSKVGVA